MKAAKTKPGSTVKNRDITLTLKPSGHVLAILNDFQKKHMRKSANAADAAITLLVVALMDYDHLIARCAQVERYCKAEGLDAHGEYIESILQAKFPRGRVPRPQAAR